MNRACVPDEFNCAYQYPRPTSYSYQDLLDLTEGNGPTIGFPKLPKPGMLMLDRIVSINQDEGTFGKGRVRAELDILPSHWFFQCHFDEDPVMPGSLGVDGLCQLVGFYLGWRGYQGKGRALGVGKTRFKKEIIPNSGVLHYQVDIKMIRDGDFPFAIAEGLILCQGELMASVSGIRVGLKPD